MAAAAFRRTVTAFVDRELSPQAIQRKVATFAREERDSMIAAGRATPAFRTFVDGREGAREESINPAGGSILYLFSVIADAVLFAFAELDKRSPATSGRPADPRHGKPGSFRNQWWVAVNGRPIARDSFAPRSVPLDAEVIIYNPSAYARKVDVQLVGKRHLRFATADPNALAETAKAVARKYGATIEAKRVWTMRVPGQWTHTRAGKKKRQAAAAMVAGIPGAYGLRRAQHRTETPHLISRTVGTPVETPCLVIKAWER